MNDDFYLQVLIPTYNRAKRLEKNIRLISKQIIEFDLQNKIGIIVSDNCSNDDNWTRLKVLQNEYNEIDLLIFKQDENIKLEPNALFVLEKASAPFVMYTGDDDYIDSKYLPRLVEIIESDKNFTCAISGHIGVAPGEINRNVRMMPFEEHVFNASLKNTAYLSHFFSQMSALVFKREGIYDAYMSDNSLRNIYPWIFFGIFNASRGNTYFLNKYKTKITDFETKDWDYDELGLIEDIIKNFSILEKRNPIKRMYLEIYLCYYAMNRFEDAKSKGFSYFFKSVWKVKFMNVMTKFFIITFAYYKDLKIKYS